MKHSKLHKLHKAIILGFTLSRGELKKDELKHIVGGGKECQNDGCSLQNGITCAIYSGDAPSMHTCTANYNDQITECCGGDGTNSVFTASNCADAFSYYTGGATCSESSV
ncbi:MAG: hypothetical protein QM528_08855 [Phycisphaerales bacterium]|nr:hypothetical protein [Phycisphaerales bacterium]